MVTHTGTITIETERLILRRFEYSDIDSMLRNWIADEKTQWDYGEPCYQTPESVKRLFDTKYIVSYSKEDYYRWAVIEKESGECIGQIAYFTMDTNNQHGEIEYVIGPAFQGKGYATEMTRAVIAFGFETLHLHRIEIDCRTENEASRKVIEKCGLSYEGVFRDFFWRKDHFEGRRVFSILDKEYEPGNPDKPLPPKDGERQVNIRLAGEDDFDIVKSITQDTIKSVYPKYYPMGAVQFFSDHHSDENIRRDIKAGRVWLLITDDEAAAGTVTLSENEIDRLFVRPSFQHKGYGKRLLDFAEEEILKNYDTIVIHASLPAKKIYLLRGFREVEYNTLDTGYGDYLCFDKMEKRKTDR